MEKNTILGLFILVILCIGVIIMKEKPTTVKKDDNVHVYFLKTKEADAIIITEKEHTIMIDTGENKERTLVMNRLSQLGITQIDLLILTHPDKDHIGNALTILKKYPVKKVYQSSFLKESTLETELKNYIKENNITTEIIKNKKQETIGTIELTIYPSKVKYNSSNNDSLITTMKTGTTNFFFGADIKKKRVEELLREELTTFDVVKVPYHGRYHEKLIPLLEKLNPKVTVITGTPEKQLETYLKNQKIQYFYTEQQEIHIVSDRKNIIIN